MEVVNTLDIDGTQWEIQDAEARSKIARIEQLLKPEMVDNAHINLKSGNSADEARLMAIQKFGKMYIGLIVLENLNANNVGTLNRAEVGTLNINALNDTFTIGFDYKSGKAVRLLIYEGNKISVEESTGVLNGNNGIRAQITWIEP